MPQIIEVPGQGQVEFPDGMTDAQITAVIQKNAGQKPAPDPTVMGYKINKGIPTIANVNDLLTGMADMAGGKVTDVAAESGMKPETAAKLGYVTNVLTQAVAPAAIAKGASLLSSPLIEGMGKWLMRSALKPSTTLSPQDSARAVKTMLSADVGNVMPGANVTQGGIGQIQSKLGTLQGAEDALIGQNAGQTVNKYAVANAGNQSANTFSNQVNPVSDQNAIARSLDEFLTQNAKVPSRTPAQVIPPQTSQSSVLNANGQPFTTTIPGRTIPASGTDEIPLQIANELKKGTYKVLGDKAYSGELKAADVDIQKALARGIKEQIELKVPEIAPINAERSDLINATKAAISRSAVAANRDPVGLGFLASNPKAALAFMANRSELIKSMLARVLYSGAERIPQAGFGGAAALGQGLLGNKQRTQDEQRAAMAAALQGAQQ